MIGASIIIKTKTWHRDSYGLFDYESKSVTKNVYHSNKNVKIYRVGKLSFIPSSPLANETAMLTGKTVEKLIFQKNPTFLFEVNNSYGNYVVNNPDENVWLVVRSL